ncbi:Vps52-domain-containing protein [Hortaea werneckii]|nr:Vps52-domain-containing protein [Hortaea werneckii]KAI7352989.1 Vps52-domain-containing protein [Hortaea werneckii]
MWLERFSGQSSQSTPSASPSRALSPGTPRRSVQLGPSTLPRRPGLNPRTSSLSVASLGASTESLPAAARIPNGTNLKNELASSPVGDVSDPVEVLESILGAPPPLQDAEAKADIDAVEKPAKIEEDIDFGGLSLEEFAGAGSPVLGQGDSGNPSGGISTDIEQERDKFEDLHKSILACDEVLKSVETYLTNFRADLAAVSSEIEHLQQRSSALNNKLQNRKAVEKVLGPEIEAFAIPSAVVRKITEGAVDGSWVKALEQLEKRIKTIESKAKEGKDVKAVQDIRPLIDDVSSKAVERIRDYVVSQIKALRSPNINAQVIQMNAFLRYRSVFGFLATKQPQLAEEISQAYINTMRWYYSSHFTRYKTALDKLQLHTIDASDVIATEPGSRRAVKPGAADAFSIGRRADVLKAGTDTALPSYAAEEDKGTHFLELAFRAFNLALIDNASAEYSFLTEFFIKQPFHATNRKFNEIFQPTFQLGHELTKQLIEGCYDAIGVLICVRLTQHFAFELQRRKVPAGEGYVNGTNMLLWPRFQQIIDAHCESIRKLTASLPGKPAGSALSLTSSPANAQSTAPHPLTQRFANFSHAVLTLSSEAGDDEPVSHSLARLRGEFEAFLLKLGKGIAEARKRERFLYNNYSLVHTILADTQGKLAEETKSHFADLRDGLGIDG